MRTIVRSAAATVATAVALALLSPFVPAASADSEPPAQSGTTITWAAGTKVIDLDIGPVTFDNGCMTFAYAWIRNTYIDAGDVYLHEYLPTYALRMINDSTHDVQWQSNQTFNNDGVDFTADGNLVAMTIIASRYSSHDLHTYHSVTAPFLAWQSDTHSTGAPTLVLTATGNLEIHDGTGKRIWQTNTHC